MMPMFIRPKKNSLLIKNGGNKKKGSKKTTKKTKKKITKKRTKK
jgi:hypothetical protein